MELDLYPPISPDDKSAPSKDSMPCGNPLEVALFSELMELMKELDGKNVDL